MIYGLIKMARFCFVAVMMERNEEIFIWRKFNEKYSYKEILKIKKYFDLFKGHSRSQGKESLYIWEVEDYGII